MPRDLTDNKSTLFQVMAWCRQASSHYLSQCWPSSMSPYDVTRPQWVKQSHAIIIGHFRLPLWPRQFTCHGPIDQLHKSHNAPVPYPTKRHWCRYQNVSTMQNPNDHFDNSAMCCASCGHVVSDVKLLCPFVFLGPLCFFTMITLLLHVSL